jgi:hypothetical protein
VSVSREYHHSLFCLFSRKVALDRLREVVMSLRTVAHVVLNMTRMTGDVKFERRFDAGGRMEEI